MGFPYYGNVVEDHQQQPSTVTYPSRHVRNCSGGIGQGSWRQDARGYKRKPDTCAHKVMVLVAFGFG